MFSQRITGIVNDPLIFCADRIDFITNFAVITNVVIKRAHCAFSINLNSLIKCHFVYKEQQNDTTLKCLSI